ncbi:MAG: glycosyltransferase [Oscillatoriaceae cyanobacterium Prado104]|nr:glycosyltransferase [Oscillatoriaceae cyanobacterium Prado104]
MSGTEKKVVEFQINLADFHYQEAEKMTELGKWQDAIASYQKALALDPNLPSIHQKIAAALQKKAQTEASNLLKFYQQKIQQNPDELQNYYQALDICPDRADLYFGLGKALAKQGQFDRAIAAYQKVLQVQPEHPQAAILLQAILLKREQNLLPSEIESSPDASQKLNLEQAKHALDTINKITLNSFLNSGVKIHFSTIDRPEISIIIILYNRAELTLSCLYSLLRNPFKSFEVILVDNNSTDATRQLLQHIYGAKIILNDENLHYLLACNQASKVATGNHLLFLNNDTQILGDSITVAVNTLKSSDEIGAVGGKLIHPDGTLQEAGSIIWKDGSCIGYGRGDSPAAPQYMFQRAVDYCSAAFLLTRRNLFLAMGGFDEDYQPAYYEETDYCVRLQKLGKKIIYNPQVAILHYEFASSSHSSSSKHAIALMEKNQKVLKSKHQDWFQLQYPSDLNNLCFARTQARENRPRILFIDDRVPHPYLGSGYTRSHNILCEMVALGYSVTLYPTDLSHTEDWTSIYADISAEIEVMRGCDFRNIESFLRERKGYYDILFVSRPHNMKHLNLVLSNNKTLLGKTKIIYDAEAIFCERELQQQRLQGKPATLAEFTIALEGELKLAEKSHCIISVSQQEQQKFIDGGYKTVKLLGHSILTSPTPNSFEERHNLLFVGSIYDLNSPNADSVLWLSESIFKIIQAQLGEKVNLSIAGTNTVGELKDRVRKLGNNSIQMLGRIDDLTDLYDRSRLFVAPTRFAAGIPHKVHEAAARGLPIVTTSIIAEQLGWKHDSELLVADSAEMFAAQCIRLYQDVELWNYIRKNALKRVEIDCDPQKFSATLQSILRENTIVVDS